MKTKIQTKIHKKNICIVHIDGEVDSSSLPELEATLKPIVDNKHIKSLVFNCVDLTFINSKVVGYVAYLHTTFSHNKRQLVFAQTNETIADILMLVGLTTIIPQYDTLEEALSNF